GALVLDEPASGLDPATRTELEAILREERERGAAILLSAHNLQQVERLCDEVVILRDGRIALQGTVAAVTASAGPARIRLAASIPFAASRPDGDGHSATFATMQEALSWAEGVRVAGGHVLELTTQRPGLEQVLAALEARA